MPSSTHEQRSILTAEVLAVAFMGAVAAAAHWTGVNLLLFPKLAALSHDVPAFCGTATLSLWLPGRNYLQRLVISTP